MKTLFLSAGIIGLLMVAFQFVSMHNTINIYLLNRQIDINDPPQEVRNFIICSSVAIDITLFVTGFLFLKFFEHCRRPT